MLPELTISGHCADRRQICGCNSSRFAYRRRPAQQLWQLGEVHRRAAGLVLGEQLGRRAPAGLVVEIEIAERLAGRE